MSGQDEELERLREVTCSALLERWPPPWTLDKSESTRDCLKYRRGKGEIILVTHGGRGWWDPTRPATDRMSKGDVFSLVQHLEPSLNFGQVRRVLRNFVGIAPAYPAYIRDHALKRPGVSVAERWAKHKPVWRGSRTWRYLTEERGLPSVVVVWAIRHGVLREGPRGSAWFVHFDQAGALTGIEMRGPDFRGFSPGGAKSLFRLPGSAPGSSSRPTRLAVAEAPIDALNLAAFECCRGDTLYLSTAGGMGSHTIAALEQLLQDLSGDQAALLVAATDADLQGDRYAEHLASIAAAAGVRSERLRPPDEVKDWNGAIQKGRGA